MKRAALYLCIGLLIALVWVAFGVFWCYAKLTDRMDKRRSAS